MEYRDFGGEEYGNLSFIDGLYPYRRPSDIVRRIALATSAQGEMLQIPAPAANSSWSLTFPAPTMRCQRVDPYMERLIVTSIVNYTFAGNYCKTGPGFTAWYPKLNPDSENIGMDGPVPFKAQLEDDDPTEDSWNNGTPGQRDDKPLTFLVAVTPTLILIEKMTTGIYKSDRCDVIATGGSKECSMDLRVSNVLKSSTVLQCDLYNSTYTNDFSFVNGAQKSHYYGRRHWPFCAKE